MNKKTAPPPPQAKQLVELATATNLFHTPDGEAYVTFSANNHDETWPVRSQAFYRWLTHCFYLIHKKPASSQAQKAALDMIEAMALYTGEEITVYTRLAEQAGRIYVDLTDEHWRVVEITPNGWSVLDSDRSPVRFRRSRGMRALPCPIAGGSIEQLRPFVNIAEETSWQLLVAFLVMTFNPSGPYPILVLQGEQGSAKSTTAKIIRSLIDPSKASLRSAPKDIQDMIIAARNSWIVSLDNLSRIPSWQSDALCRLSTGGGFATRELYTNTEEVIIEVARPVILNGIEDFIYRQDLAERSIVLNLPHIREGKRETEHDFWERFETERPAILGALCTAATTALRNFSDINIPNLPRMADFVRWVVAAEQGFSWEPGTFLAAYAENKNEMLATAVDSDPVVSAICALIEREETCQWNGTAAELLEILNLDKVTVSDEVKRSSAWPKSSSMLGNRLKRAMAVLRKINIEIVYSRDAHRRTIIIRSIPQKGVTTVTPDIVASPDRNEMTDNDGNDTSLPTA